MALVYMTGFEEFTNPSTFYLTDLSLSEFFIDTAGGRFGGKALSNNLGGGGKHFKVVGGYFDLQATVGFAYKFSAAGKPTILARWVCARDGQTVTVVRLGMDENNILYLDIGTPNLDPSNPTTVKGSRTLLPGRYYYIEWKAQISAVATVEVLVQPPTQQSPNPPFVFESSHNLFTPPGDHKNQVRVDGVLEVDCVGVGQVGYLYDGTLPIVTRAPTYGNNSETPWSPVLDEFQLMYDHFQVQNHFDDVYVANDRGAHNNDFLGDLSVNVLLPDAVGASDAWANAGGATKVASVSEVEPDKDASYVTSQTAGEAQTFTFPDMRANSLAVHAVNLVGVARRADVVARGVAYLVNGGQSADVGVTEGYQVHGVGYDVDPATGDPWAPAAVNALEAGVKVTS